MSEKIVFTHKLILLFNSKLLNLSFSDFYSQFEG